MSDLMTRDEFERKHYELLQAITDLSSRLYRDNGHRSIQARISRLENYCRVQLWVLGVIVVAWLSDVVPKIIRSIAALE